MLRKKYGFIFALSVLLYAPCFLNTGICIYEASVTARGVLYCLTFICLVYQLIFFCFLRKKENVSFRKAFNEFVRFFLIALTTYLICFPVTVIFTGYETIDLRVFSHSRIYKGTDAFWAVTLNFGYWFLLAIPAAVTVAYNIALRSKDKDER